MQVLARPMFDKIEQDYLSSTCKINQDLCLARLSKMVSKMKKILVIFYFTRKWENITKLITSFNNSLGSEKNDPNLRKGI